MSGNRSLGRWVLYFGCLAVALGALGYYWLEYIPRQREYFLNLRFRALSVIGDQFRGKVAGLAQSIDYATRHGEKAITEYLAVMVPDLTVVCAPSRAGAPPLVDFDILRFDARGGCTATTAISRVLSRSVNDELFDDVLIAEPSGRVLYQRATSSPRIVSLSELWKRAADPKSPTVEASGIDADAVRSVRLDGSEYVLLLQPVAISAVGPAAKPVNLVLAGLARSDRLAAEARHVAPKHLLFIFTPLIVVLLSGPFLKILLLTRTGRLAFRDMVFLALFTTVAAGMGTILAMSWHDYDLDPERADPDMDAFATSLETSIVSDLRLMRNTLGAFDATFSNGPAVDASRDRVDIWATDLSAIGSRFLPLDFVFWTNAAGCQVAKWSTRKLNTPRVSQTTEEHFQNIVAGRLSTLDVEPDKPFTLQARISPTTSQMIVVMAAPSIGHGEIAGCGGAPSGVVSVGMVAPIPSLASPVVPPRAGFAIFEPGGKVIFHSVPERNLHENLFEEMRSPEPWRAAVAMRAERSAPAYYRGRKYDFHVHPFRHLAGSPWNIATFREMEPEQGVIGLVWTETLTWFFALLAVLAAGFALAFVVARAGYCIPWGKQRDFILARLWPHPNHKLLYHSIAAQLAAISAVDLALVMLASREPLRWAGWLLPFLLLAPAAVTLFLAIRLWRVKSVTWKGPVAPVTQPAYVACLALCIVVLAIIPAAGLLRLCQAFEARLYLMHWQQELANQIQARELRRTADIKASPAYSAAAKKFLLRPDSALQGPANRWANPEYLQTFWGTATAPVSGAREWQPTWWHNLLTAVRPEAQVDAAESGALARRNGESSACRAFEGPERQWILRCESSAGAPVEIASTLTPDGVPSGLLWWLVAAVVLSCAYAWCCLAFRRLFILDLRYNPLPRLETLDPVQGEKHLLVLGVPLSHKDRAVRDWLKYTPPRINLYEERFHEFWLEETLARMSGELRPKAALAATVGGAASSSGPAAPWVHVSNLEAKLRNPDDRRVVADLLDKLFTMDFAGRRVRVIVTSSVDPVFHFDSVLYEEAGKKFEHPLGEHEVQRIARILHNFRKVSAEKSHPSDSGDDSAVSRECISQETLLAIGKEAVAATPADDDAVLPVIAERSRALYKLYWGSCTRSEKLLLIQLAQTGFVNPLCVDTLEVLMRKGLVRPEPQPRIMNETFRRFLTTVESPDTVRNWEREGGESSWSLIRNIALVLVAAGLGVLALTQNQAMQTATAVLSGVGAAIAGILRLVGFLGGRRGAGADTAPAA